MANKQGTKEAAGQKPRKLTYFFLNGKLHKTLHINRGTDIITAWSYPEHKRVGYTYSDTLKRRQRAFSTAEVSRMINRNRDTIENAIKDGSIAEPQFVYGISEHRRKYKYMWREEDIMDLHAYLKTVHKGRPRKDGLITPMRLPTERELRGMIRQDTILYVKVGDTFKPVWEADQF